MKTDNRDQLDFEKIQFHVEQLSKLIQNKSLDQLNLDQINEMREMAFVINDYCNTIYGLHDDFD